MEKASFWLKSLQLIAIIANCKQLLIAILGEKQLQIIAQLQKGPLQLKIAQSFLQFFEINCNLILQVSAQKSKVVEIFKTSALCELFKSRR